ncbi:MAG: nucleotidyltransferase family protein, partial [Thermoproteota archaeon]
AVVRRHSSEVVLVEVPEEEVLIDVDTLEDLRSYLQRRQPS